MDNAEFLTKLKEWCLKYDKNMGCYPESDYEGRSIYHFCFEQLTEQKYNKYWIYCTKNDEDDQFSEWDNLDD